MKRVVDANVWFAMLVEGHAHHLAAWEWWSKVGDGEAIWCRVTQMAVLRLLTSRVAMEGNPISLEEAWEVWRQIEADPRGSFLEGEPEGLLDGWKRKVHGCATTPNVWTDAYLAALAEGSGFGVVTFDKGFRQFRLDELLLLKG